ncbi:MAG: helix-turn-helix domain-containing protein [Ignavibacteriales bacterium]|nr:helix-turn-helix domain-containing protein [Ignavibacteriales bacterium]
MALDLIDFISLFTLIQLLFLTVVILNYKKGKRLSNLLLAGFMASNALLIAHFLFSRFGWISPEKCIGLFSIGNSSYLLLMPFLYLYILSLCYKDFRLKVIHLLHTIPFCIFVIYSLFIYFLDKNILRIGTFQFLQQPVKNVEFWSHHIVLHIQIFSYLIASAVVLTKYRRRLKDLFSSIEKIDLLWCNLLLVGFGTMWFMDLLNWILRISQASSQSISNGLLISSLLINLIFTLIVTYKGLAQSICFSGIQVFPKYAASRLKPSDCNSIVTKLSAFIQSEKPYLDPALSVEDLSKKLDVPVKNLSQAIHSSLHQNFYDFINIHRIEEIKKRMLDTGSQNLTLLALAYDAGFNSKSVFNAAFKKHTGMTPKEYKRHYSASSNNPTNEPSNYS